MNKIFVNSEVKKSTFILTLILIIFIITQVALYQNFINKQKDNYIDIVGSIVSKSISINPKLEKELIPIISKSITEKDKKSGRIILENYGITSNINNDLFPNFNINYQILVVSILFSTLLLILNYIQYNYFFKKVRNITLAANKILEDDYSALVNENKEGDFSKLALAFSNVRRIIKSNISNTEEEKEHLVELLQNISHQLKTRLTTMSLYNDILLNRKLTKEQRINFLENNSIQISNMNLMIQNILKSARLDANTVEFCKKEYNLNKTIEEVTSTIKDFANDSKIDLSVNLDAEINLEHDKFWIQEAFINIIKNCIEHTPQNGSVKIYLYDNPVYSRVCIEDNGEGISQNDISNIFKRFYKSKNSTKKDSVGVGLSISKSIIESHNGYIDVKSNVGEGTTFLITFMK